MIAAAQPTPEETAMASSGQFVRHAPHSMQWPRFTMAALRAVTAKTACGQTSTQRPQPLHSVSSRTRE
jgi:hypothetical protein